MNNDIIKTENNGHAVEALAHKIAQEAPTLADLTPYQLEAVARVVMGQRLAKDFDRRVDLAGIDYETEKETFLDQAGKTKSPHTRRAYASALARLDAFAARRGLPVLDLKLRDADDFAYSLAAEGRSPASVRRDIAAVSSFFSFLERRYETIRNPFRGTKARPGKKAARPFAFPSIGEALFILSGLTPEGRAAASVMAYRGLRVGALPTMTIRGERFTARSKGKDISGTLPPETLDAIRAAGLDARKPFADTTAQRIADGIRYATKKQAASGVIAAAYSAHDLRHLYAVGEYRKDRDLYRVSRLLGHASIQVTETYLKGIGEID